MADLIRGWTKVTAAERLVFPALAGVRQLSLPALSR